MVDLAEYDIETAKAMLKSGRYLYVGFMCHQVIEKALKAVVARDCAEGELSPKTHDLGKLAARTNLFDKMTDEQRRVKFEIAKIYCEAIRKVWRDSI